MSVGEIHVTIQGRVGGEIQHKVVNGSTSLASFRVAATPRQFDRAKEAWVDRPTTWFTVECWRSLAQNVATSLDRGDPVIVTGRLRTTEWEEEGEPRSRTVLEAYSVGHDLSRGTSVFTKSLSHPGSAGGLDEQMRDLSGRAETTGAEPRGPGGVPEADTFAASRAA